MEGSEGGNRVSVVRRRVIAALVLLALAGAAIFVLVGGESDGDLTTTVPPPSVSAQSSILSAQLTPDQLVDQVLLLGFDGTTKADAPILGVLATRQLGGVIVQPQNWTDAAQGAALTRALRSAGSTEARIPPLVVAAQEGGRYRSFADLPPQLTELEIGDGGSIQSAEAWARDTGVALRANGFDLNLFPVADVATLDSPIADRAFSDDPAVAAQLTAAAVRGCRDAQIACAALHFPGLGAASQDTTQGPATVSLDAASLAARDLQAFQAAFAEHVPAVVLSLAFYAAYDSVTPGALAKPVATGLLRDQLGFDGLAITDDLGSGAVRSDYSVAKAAVAALAAGADMVQIDSPEEQGKVREALLAAIDSGELSEARLREAAGRVMELKRKLGLLAAQ
jgi:beta-N-acetylhexosaminidase